MRVLHQCWSRGFERHLSRLGFVSSSWAACADIVVRQTNSLILCQVHACIGVLWTANHACQSQSLSCASLLRSFCTFMLRCFVCEVLTNTGWPPEVLFEPVVNAFRCVSCAFGDAFALHCLCVQCWFPFHLVLLSDEVLWRFLARRLALAKR